MPDIRIIVTEGNIEYDLMGLSEEEFLALLRALGASEERKNKRFDNFYHALYRGRLYN